MKQKLITAFYTVCSYAGLDGKSIIRKEYGVESTKDLSIEQLHAEIINIGIEGNKWRRRVMAAIGAKLKREKRESNANIIKAIACRAAKVENFNHIPHETLQAIYNQFAAIPKGKKVAYKQSDLQRLAHLN